MKLCGKKSFINSLQIFPGLFLYDDLYPSQLKGRGPGGSDVTLPACPKFGDEVITSFDENTVRKKCVIVFGSVKEPKGSLCLSVCPSVCPAQTCLKVSIFILEQSGSVSGQSKVSLRSV